MKAQIFFFTLFRGQKVGQDDFGNVYYRTKSFWSKIFSSQGTSRKERRWVIYSGKIEATKVPPEWFSWLHFTSDAPLDKTIYPWIKDHMPNMSGTKSQYCCPYEIKKVPKRQVDGVQLWEP